MLKSRNTSTPSPKPNIHNTKSNRDKIAKIINCQSESWNIISSYVENGQQIHMISPIVDKNGFISEDVAHLRGLVIDLKNSCICAKSYGHVSVAVESKLVPNDRGIVELNVEGKIVTFDTEKNYRIIPGHNGVIIRVYKIGGKVYHSSNQRIDTSRSRWSGSDYFESLYHKLGGPSDDDLFPPECKNSPYCYIFVVVCKELLIYTKQDVGCGYVSYLGVEKMWSNRSSNCPYIKKNIETESREEFIKQLTEEGVDIRKYPSTIQSVSVMPHQITKPFIFKCENMTLDEVNNHLSNGYYYDTSHYEDNRMRPGEFVHLFLYNKKKEIIRCIEIRSESCQWRYNMRKENQNIEYQFYTLLDECYETGFDDINEKVVGFVLGNLIQLGNHNSEYMRKKFERGFINRLKLDNEFQFEGPFLRDKIFRLLLNNYIISLPPQFQEKAIGYLDKLREYKKLLIEELTIVTIKKLEDPSYTTFNMKTIKFHHGYECDYENDYIERFHQLVNFEVKKYKDDDEISDKVIYANFKQMIDRENYRSLHKLFSSCRRYHMG